MNLQKLIQQRCELNQDILIFFRNEVSAIKLAGENMIECATNIKGQGYKSFIDSREQFLNQIDNLEKQLIGISYLINTDTHT